MRIAIGSDHAGFDLKKEVTVQLATLGYDVIDHGAYDCEPTDYPDNAVAVAKCVASGEAPLGIVICGSGTGVCIAANKVRGVRAALCHDTFSAHSSREHNHANVLCLGARVVGPGLAADIVKTWLEASESHDERHLVRIAKLKALDD